jgi:hypothetical protein
MKYKLTYNVYCDVIESVVDLNEKELVIVSDIARMISQISTYCCGSELTIEIIQDDEINEELNKC